MDNGERMKYFRGLRLLVRTNGGIKLPEVSVEKRDEFKKKWGRMIWFEIKVKRELDVLRYISRGLDRSQLKVKQLNC